MDEQNPSSTLPPRTTPRLLASLVSLISRVWPELSVSPQILMDGGWSFALKAANTALAFGSTVVMARLMGAEGYGIYSYAYAVTMVLALVTQEGMPHLLVRETAQGVAKGQPELVKGVWNWAGKAVAILSVGVVPVVIGLLVVQHVRFDSAEGETLIWALFLVPLIALGNLRGAALRGLRKVAAGQLPEFLIRPGGLLLLLLGASLVTHQHVSPPLAMALHVVAACIAFGFGAFLLWRFTPPSVRKAVATFESRRWLVSSVTFAMVSGFQAVNKQVGTLILGMLAAPRDVGVYRAAVQVSMLAAFGLQAVNTVVQPRFASLYARGNMARLQRLVTASTRVVLGFNLLVTFVFVAAGKTFFPLVFGTEFSASYAPLLILLVGQVVNSSTGSVAFLLNMTGNERETIRSVGIAAASNVILSILLVPYWGSLGAAMAAATSNIVSNVLFWLAARRKLGIDTLAIPLWRRPTGNGGA